MTRTARAFACFAIIGVLSGASAQAAAGPDDEATQHYTKGRKLLESGQFASAAAEFKASLALLPSPNTELLLAHAEREQGHKVDAMKAYNHVVGEAGARVRAGEARFRATLEEAGRWAAVLRAELGQVDLSIAGATAKTQVSLDGKPVEIPGGASGTVQVSLFREPGAARVTVTAEDGRKETREVLLTPGQAKTLSIDLAQTKGEEKVPEKERPVEPGSGFKGPPLPSWVAFGVGAAGLGMFGVFGAMASSKSSELGACSPNCPESKRGVAEDGKTDQTVANIGLAAGALGVATGVVLWVVLPAGKKTSVTVSPTRVAMTHRF